MDHDVGMEDLEPIQDHKTSPMFHLLFAGTGPRCMDVETAHSMINSLLAMRFAREARDLVQCPEIVEAFAISALPCSLTLPLFLFVTTAVSDIHTCRVLGGRVVHDPRFLEFVACLIQLTAEFLDNRYSSRNGTVEMSRFLADCRAAWTLCFV